MSSIQRSVGVEQWRSQQTVHSSHASVSGISTSSLFILTHKLNFILRVYHGLYYRYTIVFFMGENS